jgi:hypothetical protein
MKTLEAHKDDIHDDDPEALEEIERRQDELVEVFMIISLNKNHETSEKHKPISRKQKNNYQRKTKKI